MRRGYGLLWVSLLLSACGSGEDDHSVHDHVHEDEQGHHDHNHGAVVGITRWTETHELFAEHPIAVRGEETPFLAHVTVLDGFGALEDARVRLVLDGPAHLQADAPMLRSGIYRPTFTAEVAGTYQARLEIVEGGEGVIDGFEIEVVEAAPDEAEAEEEGTISLLKEQQWRVPFATAFATRASVAPGVVVAGELGTPPAGRAHIHAPVAGRVMSGRQAFPTPGQVVEPGAELATLAPTPGSPEAASQADSAVVAAEAELEDARAALERTRRLLADDAIPERQLQEAQRRVRVTEATAAAARRARSLYSTATRGRGRGTWRITSPIAGVVDDVRVSPGEAVEPNELLWTVIDPNERWVMALVPEAWVVRIRPERGVTFQLAGDPTWRPVTGSLVNVSSAVDERSRTVRAIWSLEAPPSELRVGAALRVSIPSGEAESGVVVPQTTLVDVDGRAVVYVQVEGEAFEERAVRTGATDGARIVIREGIEEGDRVVTVGGYLVRLASTAGEGGGHGHGHPH